MEKPRLVNKIDPSGTEWRVYQGFLSGCDAIIEVIWNLVEVRRFDGWQSAGLWIGRSRWTKAGDKD
jgi:hypothetical protein